MEQELRTALEALAAEMNTKTGRSKDEWVRGHDAGTLSAGRRLQDLLDRYPAQATAPDAVSSAPEARGPSVP